MVVLHYKRCWKMCENDRKETHTLPCNNGIRRSWLRLFVYTFYNYVTIKITLRTSSGIKKSLSAFPLLSLPSLKLEKTTLAYIQSLKRASRGFWHWDTLRSTFSEWWGHPAVLLMRLHQALEWFLGQLLSELFIRFLFSQHSSLWNDKLYVSLRNVSE